MSPRIVAYAAIAMLAGVPAYANQITEFSPLVTQNAFVNGSLTLALPDFDPTLGTLTGAVLTLDVFTGPQFEVLNFGSVAGTGTGSTIAVYTATGPGISSLSGSASSGTQTVTVGPAFLDLASSSPVLTFLDPSVALTDLAAVNGFGTTSFNVGESFTTSGTVETDGASLGFGGGASANIELGVVYTYEPAPEPMSIALLGAGIIGLGAARRTRRATL
jgi:hypothetical protein